MGEQGEGDSQPQGEEQPGSTAPPGGVAAPGETGSQQQEQDHCPAAQGEGGQIKEKSVHLAPLSSSSSRALSSSTSPGASPSRARAATKFRGELPYRRERTERLSKER